MAAETEFDEDLLFSEFDAVDSKPKDFSSYHEEEVKISSSMDLKSLVEENNRLKLLLKKLLVPNSCKVERTSEKPLFHAVFFNNKISSESRKKIEFFLQSLSAAKPDVIVIDDEEEEEGETVSLSNLPPSLSIINEVVQSLEDATSSRDSGDSQTSSRYAVINCAQYYEFYCIDPCGSAVVNYTSACNEGWEIPLYEQVFFTAVTCDEDSSKVKIKAKRACFNCGSVAHTLNNCPEPQNLARIDSMRKQFIKKFSSPFAKDKRYHLDEERFGAFKPGVISSELRAALGLAPNQLPMHIYRMRQLGYPPGHMPSKSNSTLLLYNASGEIEDYVMEDLEEEEEDEKRDIFFEYPGFNCPVPEGVNDRSREYGYPPISPHQSIHEMNRIYQQVMKQRSNNIPSKNINKRSWSKTTEDTVDMDVDDEEHGSYGGILSDDSTETHRKRRKHEESDTTDDGGYSPTHPDIHYGKKEQRLLEKFHHNHSSSTKQYNPSSSKSSSSFENTENGEEAKPNNKSSNERGMTSHCLEEGEILSDDESAENLKEETEETDEEEKKVNQGWWLEVPLCESNTTGKSFNPPPIPAVKLPMDLLTRFYTSSTVLQKVSFEDRIMWLDPIYGNIQVSSGRYDKLKEILQQTKMMKKGKRKK